MTTDLLGVLDIFRSRAIQTLKEHGCQPKPSGLLPAKQFVRHESQEVRAAAMLLHAVIFLKAHAAGNHGIIDTALDAGQLVSFLRFTPELKKAQAFSRGPRNETVLFCNAVATDGLSQKEAAKKFGIKIATAKKRIQRDRERKKLAQDISIS